MGFEIFKAHFIKKNNQLKLLMKKFTLLLPLLLLSCSKEETEIYNNSLPGYYKITSITSETPIDLNLDGIESTDFFNEISTPHYFNGISEPGTTMVNLNEFTYFAEIRPSKENVEFGNLTQYVNFNFPIQLIGRENPNDESSEVNYYSYVNGFMWHTYTLTDNNDVLLEHTLQSDIDKNGTIYKMIRLDENSFEIYIDLKVFKYLHNEWTTTKVKATYVRTS